MTTNPDISLEQNISSNETTPDEAEIITIQENDFDDFVDPITPLPIVPVVPGEVIYVNQNATGNNDGASWENAYTDLQSALNSADSSQEIWVAEGTYYPTTDGNRDISFDIPDGVEVYGGFDGTETEREQRNWFDHRVVLSGDIGTQDDRTDNSYSVVTINSNDFLNILDGFTIVDGQSDVDEVLNNVGGGIFVLGSDEEGVNLNNLIIANNFAEFGGGGVYSSNSVVNLNNVAFLNNESSAGGGAAFEGEQVNVNNSLFVNNRADNGGAIAGFSGLELNVNNSTFARNQAERGGGAIDSSDRVNIENSIFEFNPTNGNQLEIDPENSTVSNSIVFGGYEDGGENIIDADPLFVDPNAFDFSLQADSPAIDAGNNTAIEGINTDFIGNARITNDIVDLGAYEFVLTSEDINETPDNPETPDGEPVYRFFIPDTGVHFYTVDESEREDILETQPDYVLEGTPYSSAPPDDSLTGVAPIYRFLNTDTGVRIYTIAEAERDSIETLSNYEPEGIAYYGYTEQVEDTTPVFRFYNPIIDAHFYTSSTVERDSVLENLPDYQLESNGGIAFYVEPIFSSETPIPSPSDPTLPPMVAELLSQLRSEPLPQLI